MDRKIKRMIILQFKVFIMVILFACSTIPQKPGGLNHKAISIIPYPHELTMGSGTFPVNKQTRIVYTNARTAWLAEYAAEQIGTHCGFVPLVYKRSPATIKKYSLTMTLLKNQKNSRLYEEYYELVIKTDNVLLSAYTQAGLFYGIQTVRQLLFESRKNKALSGDNYSLPVVSIKDRPRLKWRGLMLDVSRHFQSKDFIKRYIDLIAYHKMNVLHLHLTDDQAWRIAIKKYPLLTRIGSTRKQKNGSIHSGHYTREDIRDIVLHAQKRFVTIVPEIDFPCHITAALAAYPELSCTGGPYRVKAEWGVFPEALCVGNGKSFKFVRAVLTEIIEMFPSEYIHVGGDECRTDRWEECPKCRTLQKKENIETVHNLQDYFMRQVEHFLRSKGKRMIGWDEILNGNPGARTIIQVWRDHAKIRAAAKNGNQAILSPNAYLYLDFPVSSIDLKKVYSFEPVPRENRLDVPSVLLGIETAMWTEYAPQNTIDSKVFPRLLAVSEIAWTPAAQKNYQDFLSRARFHYFRLKKLGVAYGPETEPWIYNIKHYFKRKFD